MDVPNWLTGRVVVLDSGCWQWQGALQPNGYGRIYTAGKDLIAHRVVYVALVGPIPAGHDLDHICHTRENCTGGPCLHRSCVNPEHLVPVTHRENIRRGFTGRAGKGPCPHGLLRSKCRDCRAAYMRAYKRKAVV